MDAMFRKELFILAAKCVRFFPFLLFPPLRWPNPFLWATTQEKCGKLRARLCCVKWSKGAKDREREREGGARNVMSLRSLLRLAPFSPFFASVPSSSSHCVGSFQFIYYCLLQIYWLGNKGKNSIIKQQQQQRNLSARTSPICRTKLRRPWAMKAVCAYWAQRPGWLSPGWSANNFMYRKDK